MYFNDVQVLGLNKIIEKPEKIRAHIDGDRIETLSEHAELALDYLLKIIKDKELDLVLLNLENKLGKGLSDKAITLYREMLLNTIYLHDIGKINSNFQYKKMKNKYFANLSSTDPNDSSHSMLSALIYINYYFPKIRKEIDKAEQNVMYVFLLLNAYVISKHHADLDSLAEFREKIVEGDGKRFSTEWQHLFNSTYTTPIDFHGENLLLDRLFKIVIKTIDRKEAEEKESSIYLYIYVRFLSSLLLASDYYATSHFKNEKEIKSLGEIDDINRFYSLFKDTQIYKNIVAYKQKSYGKTVDFSKVIDINVLRNELFLEAEANLLNNIDENIFYLEAPTGSGKSNVAFNLGFQLVEEISHLNKIFYVYPFNTLIEQNISSLEKIFGHSEAMEDIAVINSIVPIKTTRQIKDEESEVMNNDYEISLLNRQFLHYPLVLTTHVSIFNYLFGSQRSDLFPLCHIANSVIILDEIQSYKNNIWKEIITFLKYYADVLNIKIIIMSATLPNLNKLLSKTELTVNLVTDKEKYFQNPIFKNRVELDFSLLEVTDNILEILLEHIAASAISSEGNILIEFITKKTANEFYRKLKAKLETMNYFQKELKLITGDDNSLERKKIIDETKTKRNIILVGTQVIEAGVDIDMDIGYKDISLLDAEEQFLGRINRSCLKKGSKAYFFNYDNPAQVYKMDVRNGKHLSLLNDEMRSILNDKAFIAYYEIILNSLKQAANRINDDNYDRFIKESVQELNFTDIEQKLRLIDEHYEYSIFLSKEIVLENKSILDGKEVWQEYVDLLKNDEIEYAEKKVRLSQVTEKLYYFIYKVKNNNFTYQDNVGDIYYLADGEKYFTEGKFDRKKFGQGYHDLMI